MVKMLKKVLKKYNINKSIIGKKLLKKLSNY